MFAYSVEEMPGIDPEVSVQQLNVNPDLKPVRQKKRHLGPTRNPEVSVQRLLEAWFIRETHYP